MSQSHPPSPARVEERAERRALVEGQAPSEGHVDARRRARERGREQGMLYRKYMLTSVSGMEVGVSIAMGCMGGWWLDRRYDTAPLGLVAGLCLGSAYAILSMYRLYVREVRDAPDDDDASTLPEDDHGG